jgi:hypothetical protein
MKRVFLARRDKPWGFVKRKAKCRKVGGMKRTGIRKIWPQMRAKFALGALISPAQSTFHKETHKSMIAKIRLIGLGFRLE